MYSPKYMFGHEPNSLLIPGAYETRPSGRAPKLKVNPRTFAEWFELENVTEFPNLRYRNGKELVKIDDLCQEFYNFYGSWARVVFTVNLDLKDYAENWNAYENNGIIIPKGTSLWLHDAFYNGTCSIGECELQHDLKLKKGIYQIVLDGQSGWGLNKICGGIYGAWNGTEISIA